MTGDQTPAFKPFENADHLTIGRASTNDIRLDGLQISNHHARVTRLNSNLFMEDVGSTNGVYVNGKRITGKIPVGAQRHDSDWPVLVTGRCRSAVSLFSTLAQRHA